MRAVPTDFEGNAVPGPMNIDLNASMGFNAGDGTRPLDLSEFYKKYPAIKANRDHFFQIGTGLDAQREGFRSIDRELQDRAAHKNGQAAFAQEETRVFEMVRDPKTGKDSKVYKESTSERLMKEIKELNAQREANLKRASEIPPNLTGFFDNGARKNLNVALVELQMGYFANDRSVAENGEIFRAEEKAFRDIAQANLTDAEVAANVEAYLAPRIQAAKDAMLSNAYALIGGLNGARFALPTIQQFVEGGNGYTLPEDLFAVLLAKDDSLLNWIKGQLVKANAGKRQISLADRPRLLREQGAKFMLARRHLEFSCRVEEAESGKTRRPRNTPWEILAWCERAPAELKVVAPDASDFEGDDE